MITRLRLLNLVTNVVTVSREIFESIFLAEIRVDARFYERTLVNSGEKHNIVCWRLIWRTKTDDSGCLGIFPLFDVTESRFSKAFRSARGTIGPKEFVAASDVPISCH